MPRAKSMPPARTKARPPAVKKAAALERSANAYPARPAARPLTPRDIASVLFRRLRLIIAAFLVIFLGTVAWTCMLPRTYEASMKILVKHERPEPVVSADSGTQSGTIREVSQEDLNSEVELLRSHDLLEKVVVSCGLHTRPSDSWLDKLYPFGGSQHSSPEQRIPAELASLARSVDVEPIPKSKMILVTYRCEDPEQAASVLQTLTGLYLEKHVAVHRPPGALDFFEQQANEYKKGLTKAEGQLASFSRKKNLVSADIEKDITLRRLSEAEAQMRDATAAQAALEERIRSLEAQTEKTPSRIVTQVRTTDNSLLLQQLRSTLLNLELKRTELLTKYDPAYRTVQEVDSQIAQTRQALEEAEKRTLRDETTDLDKTRQWLDEELSRARTELATLKARSTTLTDTVEAYRQDARRLSGRDIEHQDLLRATKTAEANYLLYLRKQEEARISDALDRKRIVNVAIVEAATVPALPSSPNVWLNTVLGFGLALLAGVGLAFGTDLLDATFRTPEEVEHSLGIPVIASLPRA
jgi:uncharacterized protein involved in exopolysaccharide biosynthesis